jgi:hypothetical protein
MGRGHGSPEAVEAAAEELEASEATGDTDFSGTTEDP